MKTYITMSGFYEGIKARRVQVFGRLELLKVIDESPPYWFIRLRGSQSYDAKYWDNKDTGLCSRFAHLELAHAKFAELCSHLEYQQAAEEAKRQKSAARERALEMQRNGKLSAFRTPMAALKAQNSASFQNLVSA